MHIHVGIDRAQPAIVRVATFEFDEQWRSGTQPQSTSTTSVVFIIIIIAAVTSCRRRRAQK
jgi:nickel-dependent lactate racemase